MEWWNDLWLNEGFASFVEVIGTDHFDSSFHVVSATGYKIILSQCCRNFLSVTT